MPNLHSLLFLAHPRLLICLSFIRYVNHVFFINLLFLHLSRLVASMVFYGLSLNSGNLAGNLYVNFELMGLVEIIAYIICLALLNRTGRKILYIVCMIVGGGACLSTIFTVLFANECKFKQQQNKVQVAVFIPDSISLCLLP